MKERIHLSYTELEEHIKNLIEKLEPGTEFFLKDILVNPPAQLGRFLYKEVSEGRIKNVIYLNNVVGVEKYKKV